MKSLLPFELLSSFLLATTTFASPFPSPVPQDSATGQNPLWPNSYLALGDSFAAGIGAGNFWKRDDIANKACKRFQGSYPAVLRDLSILGNKLLDSSFSFLACSGDVLDGIDKQRQQLGPRAQFEVVTLSISGNDFGFANVVEACVYNIHLTDAVKDNECNIALTDAEQKIEDPAIWTKYRSKVADIYNTNMDLDDRSGLWSLMVITGYPKFWATPAANDACEKIRFPLTGYFGFVSANLLRFDVRQRMNDAVDTVNAKIQSEVVSFNPNQIKFIDIDQNFGGHRFCEPGTTNQDTATGSNNNNIWFISFGTRMSETEYIPAGTPEEAVWAADGGDDFDATNLLHRESVFHPKRNAHIATAIDIQQAIIEFGTANGRHMSGPFATASNCSAPEAPASDCASLQWGDLSASVDLSNTTTLPCYTYGTRKWCDVLMAGSCEASVGWDTAVNNGKPPTIALSNLKTFVDSQLNGTASTSCVVGAIQEPGDCSLDLIPQVCITPWLACMKGPGTQCRPDDGL